MGVLGFTLSELEARHELAVALAPVTAIFSLIDAVLLKLLPVEDTAQLVIGQRLGV